MHNVTGVEVVQAPEDFGQDVAEVSQHHAHISRVVTVAALELLQCETFMVCYHAGTISWERNGHSCNNPLYSFPGPVLFDYNGLVLVISGAKHSGGMGLDN